MKEIASYEADTLRDLQLQWHSYRSRFKKEVAKDKHIVLRSMKTNTCRAFPSGTWSLFEYQLVT